MTEKRFTLHKGLDTLNIMDNTKFNEHIYINKSSKDMELLVGVLNALHDENEQLKKELQRIYDVATLKKARDIVDKIYDDLLYETSEKSDYARNKVLECLEKLDEFGDGLE